MKMKRGELVGFQGCLGYDYDSTDKTISIFESIVEKVFIGEFDEEGNANPYKLTFVYKTGLSNTVQSKMHKQINKKGSGKSDVILPSYSAADTRGVRGRNTKGHRVIILEFVHFAKHFAFSADGEDFRNKKLIEGVKVLVAVRI